MDGVVASSFVEKYRPWLLDLETRHQGELGQLQLLDAHYQGCQPMSYMAPELLLELGDRLRQVVIHWPELVVDSVEERLDVEGFRLGGQAAADSRLWSIWQGNGLDLGSHQAQVDALVMRRSFMVVGTRGASDLDPSAGVDDSIPLITWESPLEMYAARDPRSRRVKAAAKWLTETPMGGGADVRRAALYLPGSTSWWVHSKGHWEIDTGASVGIDKHDLGVVPVVALINRPRTSSKTVGSEGWSDLEAVIPLSDAACKIATDLMVGAEYHALPRRWATGLNESDVKDADGRPVSALSRVTGRLWGIEDPEAKVGQFPEANLTGFLDTLKLLGQLVASVSGLPPHYLGSATDNPASADAIRSSEARLIKRAERKQKAFGEAYEQVMRIALLVADGEVPPTVRGMETDWRDASTPTVAQAADAAVKKYAAGIVPLLMTRRDLGYSETQISLMEKEDEKVAEQAAQRAATMIGVGPNLVMPGDMPGPPAPAVDQPAA